jgi:hypothetical protein
VGNRQHPLIAIGSATKLAALTTAFEPWHLSDRKLSMPNQMD